MIGKALPLFSLKKRITSVARLQSGFPLSPPVSFLLSECNPSLLIVVLVAITPAICVSFTISMMSNNCLSVRSGAIFRRIGLGVSFAKFLSWRVFSNCLRGSFSCNERRLGVLGELTFTTK